MPSLLGYDSRTKFARAGDAALAGLVSYGLAKAGYTGSNSSYTRSAMPPLRRVIRRWRSGRRTRKRRSYRRKYNKRGRGVSSRYPAGRGPLQNYQRRQNRLKLNTRLTRNDYDSTREIANKGFIQASSLSIVTGEVNFSVIDFPLALAKLFDYEEYKMVNLQYVITPQHIANGAAQLKMSDFGDPYLYILPRMLSEDITTTPELKTIQSTPGVLRFSYLRTKPIVINVRATATEKRTFVTDLASTDYVQENTVRPFGWLRNPQDSGPPVGSNYPTTGNLYYYAPSIVGSSDFQPRWRVQIYATILLRNNRSLIV